ncbi:hypothetical protein DPMN_189585 [Dreissena polymorpha]|uniref:Uncharacterized protein n=1 Tax=Dreissena polymorpha TaxID=45954 RepID=A0A9D4DUK7_DREPO|nr:hypothetical protein DPMN_189585 [Dreissena polymorpha]
MRTTPALDTSQLLWTGYSTLLPKSAFNPTKPSTFSFRKSQCKHERGDTFDGYIELQL